MTYSIGLISIPAALFWEIVEALDEMGIPRTYLTNVPGSPLPTTAIDMNQLGLVINREDDRDILISSSALVELIELASKDAFAAGFDAGLVEQITNPTLPSFEAAWQGYDPSAQVRDKINSFYKESNNGK